VQIIGALLLTLAAICTLTAPGRARIMSNLQRQPWVIIYLALLSRQEQAPGRGYVQPELEQSLQIKMSMKTKVRNRIWSLVFLAVLWGFPAGISHAAITYFDSSVNPTDNTDPGSETTVTITPPASMLTGDLVLMLAYGRGNYTHTITQAGGQTWTTESRQAVTASVSTLFWCRFNGTWSASPVVDFETPASNASVVMHVFRPTTGTNLWAKDVNESATTYSAPSTPYTVTITGISTLTDGALVFAAWTSADDNTWDTLTGGWSQAGLAQYRNLYSSDESSSAAYKVMATHGASGDVSENQAIGGGDAGTIRIIAFKEYSTATNKPIIFNRIMPHL
jgi:hypothetical protein